jgi:DNA polymerase I
MTHTQPRYPLVLVDGSSYLFRAYHALPPLTNPEGHPTGAMYGVLNMLRKLLTQYQPKQVAVVFDCKEKTFRHDLYPAYKANRPPMPEELAVQIEPLHRMIKAMGLPLLKKPGLEADDIIGSLAHEATQKGMDCLISTGDKDFAQLVSPHVTLINTMTNTLMDEAGVHDKFGVRPDQIIDYLALIGDKVDNVPGVNKVGPKTACKWLDAYGSLEGIMDHADDIQGKVGLYLKEALTQLPLSKELVTIKLDAESGYGINDLTPTTPNTDALHEAFTRFGFKRWVEELQQENQHAQAQEEQHQHAAHTAAPQEASYPCITSQTQLQHWMEKLKQAPCFALDLETTSLDPREAQCVGFALAVAPGDAAYLPVAHQTEAEQLSLEEALHALKPLLNDPNRIIIGHNLKYDLEVLANRGLCVKAQLRDTLIQDYVLDSGTHSRKLDDLVWEHLQHRMIPFHDVVPEQKKAKKKKQAELLPLNDETEQETHEATMPQNFSEVALNQATAYAAEDADFALQLYLKLNQHPHMTEKQKALLEAIEWPMVHVLASMEQHGVLIDSPQLHKQSQHLGILLTKLTENIHDAAGEAFNLDSPKQLRTLLFEKMQLPVIKKTPKGQASTSEEVLQTLALDHPMAKDLLLYRSLSKLKSTYTDKLPEEVHPKTGRIHTSYNQTGTATGRLSSSKPNLQNIPIRTEEGRKIRKAFIAEPNHILIAADYSQVELRIMAHLSGEKNLIEAFKKNEDVHRKTAAETLNTALEAVTDEQRRHAKAINFGLMYGMSSFGLAKQLGIPRHSAQAYIDTYFQNYPGVMQYMEQTREAARAHGYVETLLGRRLYVPTINSKNHTLRSAAERAAINAPLQGSCADIIKIAMIQLQAWTEQASTRATLWMQVHDELIFNVHEAFQDDAAQHIQRTMEQAYTLNVPLKVTVGRGKNWHDAH